MRFVEPAEVTTPSERMADPSASFGVQTDPDDVETVLGYWIGGRLVDVLISTILIAWGALRKKMHREPSASAPRDGCSHGGDGSRLLAALADTPAGPA